MKTIEKYKLAKLVALYTCYFSKIQNREDDKRLHESIKRWFNWKYSDIYINHCMDKYKFKKMSFVELDILYMSNKEEFDKFKYPVRRVRMFCSSCHTSSSLTKQSEIIEQTYKYGEFICLNCENNAKNHMPSKKHMISYNGIYHDEGCSDPKTPMLGFGGSWFLIRMTDKIWITNNLFSITSFHDKLQKFYAKKINAAVIHIENKDKLELLLTSEELEEVKIHNGGLNWGIFNNNK